MRSSVNKLIVMISAENFKYQLYMVTEGLDKVLKLCIAFVSLDATSYWHEILLTDNY